METSRSRRGRASAALLLLLAALLLGSVYALTTTSRSTDLVEHTRVASLALAELLNLVVDAERGERGYLTVHDARFLEPYEVARTRWQKQLDEVERLTRDNPVQQQNARQLRPMLDAKMSEIASTVRLRDTGISSQRLTDLMLDDKGHTDEIRRVIADMEAEEQRLLRMRHLRASRTFVATGALFAGAALAFAVLLTVVFRQRTREETRRKLAEHQAALFEQAPIGVVVVDPAGRITSINAQAERLFGYGRGELGGKSVEILVPPRARDGHPGYLHAFSAASASRLMGAGRDLHGLRKDGTEVPIEVGLAPLQTVDGARIAASVADISARKRAERELERMVAREKAGREEAEKVAHFSEMFVGIVSHDLRNPLNAIGVAGKSILLSAADDGQRRMASRIVAGTQRMARMIDQLLDLTRIRLGTGLSLTPAPLNLGQLAREIAEETEAAHDCVIQTELLGDLTGRWDTDRLGQVFSNLLANAAVHGKRDRPIAVRIDGNSPTTLRLQIRNDGSIPADLLPELFEAFRGSDRRASSQRGLGLGLYITREIVRAHGGAISARCDDGATTVEIDLPRGALA